MNVLNIPQNEEKRYLVQKGRNIHDYKLKLNQDYLRKKLGVINKISDVIMYSYEFKINGKVDEVLFNEDGSATPLDYKYSFNERNFKTFFYQGLMYCLMVNETFKCRSDKAYICYIREKNKIKEINYNEKNIENLKKILDDIINITTSGQMPKKKASNKKCVDCTYRKLCV